MSQDNTRFGTMQAARFKDGVSSTVLISTEPRPEPAPDEVLVRVYAAGLNPKDGLVRPSPSGGLGFDFAGEVAGLGRGVTDLIIGEYVWGFLDGRKGGSVAEFVAVPRRWLSRVSAVLPWAETAALPLVASAALQGLRDRGRLRSGERLLIRGAAGGVGLAAVQLAKRFGCHVTALAGNGLEFTVAVGADVAIDYRYTDLKGLEGSFDLFLDCVGGVPVRDFRGLLAKGGRWVTVAPNLPVYLRSPLSPILQAISGGPRFEFVVVRPRSADLEFLAGLVAEGRLRMPTVRSHALSDAGTAFRAVLAGVQGKHVVATGRDQTIQPFGLQNYSELEVSPC